MAENEKYFILEIVTPERQLLSEKVQEAVLPGEEGYFGVMPGHEPFIAMLSSGRVMYRQGNEEKYAAVHMGFAEVLPDKVIVAAENAERPEEIDVDHPLLNLLQLFIEPTDPANYAPAWISERTGEPLQSRW